MKNKRTIARYLPIKWEIHFSMTTPSENKTEWNVSHTGLVILSHPLKENHLTMWVNDLKKIHFIWSSNHPSEICSVEIVRDNWWWYSHGMFTSGLFIKQNVKTISVYKIGNGISKSHYIH